MADKWIMKMNSTSLYMLFDIFVSFDEYNPPFSWHNILIFYWGKNETG